MAAAQKVKLDAEFIASVEAGIRNALSRPTADGPEWFGPGTPIAPSLPSLPAAEAAGVAGRKLDYPFAFNTNFRPRAAEAVGFAELRAFADSCDILRLVIETRKDQVCALPWAIQKRRGPGEPRPPKNHPAARAAEEFFRDPDKASGWADWLRLLLEDLFVLDAPAIYVRKTVGGALYALEPIDGSTIKPLLDHTGRRPMEGPAFQQVLKGFPAVEYTSDELIYRPRNVRTHKVYGHGPVEQIISTINLAIRRQIHATEYFTAGTVPDALAGVPEGWSTEQIKEFQLYFDLLLTDDQASRRKLRFVPGEIARNFHETKQPPLKDMFDEWIARIVCYCFSIDVTPFVSQVNRSVAETNREQSLAEGLGPIQQWIKALVDRILAVHMGAPDLELSWQEGEVVDPKKRADIAKVWLDAKVLHPDEAREMYLGLDPLTDEQKSDMKPPAPVLPGADPNDPNAPPGAKKPPNAPPGAKKPDAAEEPA